jgi:DNA-binding MarR family transcriptional regulator
MDLADTIDCRCLAARRTARTITRHFEAELRQHGLKATQFSILASLALGGPKPMNELAEFLGLERTTLTRGAALLRRNGWIGSEITRDRRERPIKITASGRKKLEAAYPSWKAAQESVPA